MSERKPIQLTVKFGLLQPLTYFVVCDDGAMFWCQPKNGQEIDWKRIKPIPQEAASE